MALNLSQFTDWLFDQGFSDRDSSGRWDFSYKIGVTDQGKIAIRELTITPRYEVMTREGLQRVILRRVPDAGITTRLLRSFTLEPARSFAEAYVFRESKKPGKKPPTGVRGRRERAKPDRRPRGRPQERPPSFYKAFARRWLELARDRHANVTLAAEYGLKVSTVVGIIRRCRHDMGLIPR